VERGFSTASLAREQVDLKHAVIRLKDGKNGNRRVIPLPIQVVETFQHRPAPLRDYFPDWTYSMLKERVSQCMRALGLSDVTFHTLRHTFASHAVMAGVDLYTLAKLLGHRDITMVQRYAHLAPDHLKAAVRLTATALFAGDLPHHVPHVEQARA
jgi:integrase